MSNENTQLIKLQSSHITQFSNNGIKTDWMIRENISSKEMYKLPKILNEQEVFGIIDFARKYELCAFNKGIAFQKTKQNLLFLAQIKDLEKLIIGLKEHNHYLADALDKATKRGS